MIGNLLIVFGVVIFMDAVYSITLYLNAPSYEGSKKQTWRKDHWVRVVRGLIAISVIVIGFIL